MARARLLSVLIKSRGTLAIMRSAATVVLCSLLIAAQRLAGTTHAFQASPIVVSTTARAAAARSGSSSSTQLSMVLEKPPTKKLAKIEQLKIDSDHLIHPLKEVGVCLCTGVEETSTARLSCAE